MPGINKQIIQTGGGTGSGDMLKSTYDVNDSGYVDSAHKIQIAFINKTGATLTKGTIVYLKTSSASANFPEALKANASTETTSSKTIGAVYEDVANDATGYIITHGEVDNLDTSAYSLGDRLWLATTDGGITTTKPSPPNHAVFIGTVTRSQAVNGRISYTIMNGYEVDELHDVSFTSLANDDIFQRKGGLWVNRTPAQVKTDLAISTTDVSGLQEYVEDTIGTKVVAGTNVTVSYNDTTGETTINSTGGGTPGGADTQVQVNNAGAFAGYSDFRYIDADKTLYLGSEGLYGGLSGVTATSANTNGGDLSVVAGDSTGYGTGGDFVMGAGKGGESGDGGEFIQTGGYSGDFAGDGGQLTIQGGRVQSSDNYTGKGGALIITGGTGKFGGGDLFIGGGSSGPGFGLGGSASIEGGSGEIGGDITLSPGYSTSLTTNGISTYSINNAGTGYAIYDKFTVNTGSVLAEFQVIEVGGSGDVTSIKQVNLGSGYSTGTNIATTNTVGTGTGLTIDILTLVSGGDGKIYLQKPSFGDKVELDISNLTANRVATFQDASGTIAYLSDIGGGTITEVEIDFGSGVPVSSKKFTITDAGVSGTSKILVYPSGNVATGRVGDDWEWDSIAFAAKAGTGNFTLTAKASGRIRGKRKIFYSFS